MINIANKPLYFDLTRINNIIEVKTPDYVETETIQNINEDGKIYSIQVTTRSIPTKREIDISKYELINMMIQVVLSADNVEVDDTLGAAKVLSEQSIPFKLAYNTLEHNGIILPSQK